MADAAGGKDCVLHCDGGNTQLAVHSTILKLWSPVLRGALETGSELELGGGSPATPPACTMTHLPLPQDSAADWSVVLSLIYPPTRSPRPAITWETVDNVIRIADKYAMKGLLIMVEDFIMQAAAAATQAGPHTCAGASSRSGGADQQQQLRQRAPHGSLEGSGDSSEPSAAAATPAASVGGPGVFSPHAGDVNYVWRWLELGDRLQMPHVIERCIDFVSSEALLAGDRSDPYPKETPQALLAVLGAATLQKLVSRLVREATTCKAALANEGLKPHANVAYSYSQPAGNSEFRWGLAVGDHNNSRWRPRCYS